MPVTPVKEPLCKCCGQPIVLSFNQKAPAFDKDIGQVCNECQTNLRWAQAYLKAEKIVDCTPKTTD